MPGFFCITLSQSVLDEGILVCPIILILVKSIPAAQEQIALTRDAPEPIQHRSRAPIHPLASLKEGLVSGKPSHLKSCLKILQKSVNRN